MNLVDLPSVTYHTKDAMPTVSVNTPIAEILSAALTENGDTIRLAVELTLPMVRQEIQAFDDLRNADSRKHARACLLFAILSPQLDFDKNVELAAKYTAAIDRIETLDDVRDLMFATSRDGERQVRVNLWQTKVANVWASLEYIRNATAADMTKAAIMAARKRGDIFGMSHKTAALASHLFDARSEAFTLDIWMLRLAMLAAGMNPAVTVSATDKGYETLERAWIAWARENFPNETLFAVQWAAWNTAGFGQHVSHLGIFG